MRSSLCKAWPSPCGPRSRGLRLWRRLVVLVVLAVLPLVPACQGDHLNPPPLVDPTVLYWDLALNHQAVTLSTTAPYDTLTLIATPRNQAGEALTGLPAPQYHSTDPGRVVVTADGILVAEQVTSDPVAVIATLTTDNLKHVDTVLVRVVDAPTPPVLGTFSIDPVPPDSAKYAMRSSDVIPNSYLLNHLVHAADASGMSLADVSVDFDPWDIGFTASVPIADLLVSFRSSDTTVAVINTRSIGSGMQIFTLVGLRPGTTKLYASTTAFGVTKADTLSFRIGLPLVNQVTIRDTLGIIPPTPYTMGVGALIVWGSRSLVSDITFSDPTNVAAPMNASPYIAFVCFLIDSCTDTGNISSFTGIPLVTLTGAGRTFTRPGTYDYQATVQDASGNLRTFSGGRIVVVDER